MARLPDDVVQQIMSLHSQGIKPLQIAEQLQLNPSTIYKRLKKYGNRTTFAVAEKEDSPPNEDLIDVPINRLDDDGTVELLLPNRAATLKELMARCQVDPKKWVCTHYKVGEWQSFYRNKERTSHTRVPMFRASATFKRILEAEIEEAILEFVRENVTALPSPPRIMKRTNEKQFMTVWGIWDAHVGMYAWADEVRESFDLDIARNRVMNSIDDMCEELKLYEHERIVMPMGNDFMHFDSVRMTTTKSDNFLDFDGRYAKVFKAAIALLVYQVQKSLELCDKVEVIWIPGNHDYSSSFGLVAAVNQRFINDPRVTVNLGANPRKYIMHGGCLIGFDHGQKCKPAQLARIMSEEQIHNWSKSTYREIQIGHKHQRWLREFPGIIPTNGVTIRMNPALCNVDMWHHEQGLIGEPVKSVEAYRYDKTGYRGSHSVWARDEEVSRSDSASR